MKAFQNLSKILAQNPLIFDTIDSVQLFSKQTKNTMKLLLFRKGNTFLKSVAVTFSLILFLIISQGSPAMAASVFYDSFDKATIDTNKWTIIDTESKLSVSSGDLNLGARSSPGYGDPSLYSTSTYSRVAGRTLVSVLKSSLGFGDGGPVIHFSTTNSTSTPTTSGYGTYIDGANGSQQYIKAVVPGAGISYGDSISYRAYSNDYLTATILRPTGSYHLISGGTFGTYPTATLFWVNETGTDDSLYVGINNKTSNDKISSVRVVDLTGSFTSQYGLATAADGFSRSGSINGTTVDLSGSQTWTTATGTFTADGSKVTSTAAAKSVITATSDGIFEADMTSPASGGFTGGLIFRYSDSNNYWVFWGVNDRYQLGYYSGGIFTLVDQTGASNFGNGQTKRLRVVVHGNRICPYANTSQVLFGCQTNAFNNTATGAGISNNSAATISFDNFAAWPKTVTLPTSTELFPTVPSSGATTLISDTFTAVDTTRLNTHTPDTNTPGGSWTEQSGTWTINSNVVSPAATSSYATIETGQTDMAISTDISLGAQTEWFAGLTGRWIDSNNKMIARFLWQSASPEIEFWDTVGGATANFCAVSLIGDISQSTTYNMKMVIVGNKVGIYLNTKLVLECVTSNLTGTKAGIIVDSLGSANTYDNFIVTTAASDAVAPSEVTDLAAGTTPTASNPSFTWTTVYDDAAGTNYYRVYRSDSSGSLGSQINTNGNTTTGTYSDSSLAVSGTYYYTVQAVDTTGNENTWSDNNQVSVTFTGGDSTAPSLTLTSLSPDPTTDSTPTLVGTATESIGTVSAVQFQLDATSGSWTACTANDGTFDEATETFTCNVSSALSDGSHTIYVRATDSNSNTTSNANASTDIFTIDTTDPASFDLDSPSDKAYTSESKQTFRWKKTTDSGSGLSKYQVVVDGKTIIDDINPEDPGSSANHVREDSNKYVKYDGNYIEARTKQDSKELDNGTVKWEVNAIDNAGNTRSSGTRTLYVDLDSPIIQLDSIATLNGLTLKTTSNTGNAYTTTDQTPTFKGVADAESTITVTINSDTICETTTNDDSSWECTPDTSIPYGRHEVTITAKSKAGKTSTLPMFYLFVSSGSLNTTLLETTTTPKKTETVVPTKETTCKTYTVKYGDSLYGIAFSELGDGDKYKDLIELNKNEYPSLENNPQAISTGWELKLSSCNATEKDTTTEKTGTTEESTIQTYDVKVKVVDTNKQAVKGAKVTLFSTPRETTTDENGLAMFNDVEKGDHKVVIDYKGQVGEQPVTLDGEVEEFSFTVQIESKSPFTNPWVIIVISILALLLIAQAVWFFILKKK